MSCLQYGLGAIVQLEVRSGMLRQVVLPLLLLCESLVTLGQTTALSR